MVAKIYTRLSRDEANQTSTADQERECRRLAQRLTITSIEVFAEEPGTSAYKDVPRPVFDALMTGIQKGDVIIAWALDRVTRHGMEEAGRVLRILEERGARLVTVSDGVDTGQLDTDINVGIRAIMARDYSKRISANVKRGKASRAASGLWNGGQRWYGYQEGHMALDEAEAALLRQCAQWYIQGERPRTIAKRLNDNGHFTVGGHEWRAENLQRLLFRKRYLGIRTHNGVEYPAVWPAIFTREIWETMNAVRMASDRQRNFPKGPTGARTYLLTGFAQCGNCGGKMVGNKERGQRRYKCFAIDSRGTKVGCGKVFRIADPVELMIKEALFDHLATQKETAPSSKGRMQELLDTQQQLTLKLAEAHRDYYVEAELSKADYIAVKSRLDAKLEVVDDELATLLALRTGITLDSGQTLAEAWDTASLVAKRSLLNLHLDKLVIQPGHPGMMKFHQWRFNPKYIEISWRKPVLV